jgi:trk system potassium uptake protein
MQKYEIIDLEKFGSSIAQSLKGYDGEYMIMNILSPKSFIGKSIRDLQIGARFQCQILAVRYIKGNDKWSTGSPEWENMKIAPTANEIIPDHSVLLFLGRKSDLLRIQQLD